MLIRPAAISEVQEVISFFDLHLAGSPTIKEMPELGCAMGVRAAIRRDQLLVAFENEYIIAALRFYRRKRDGGVSLYQFAVKPEFRGRHLLNALLKTLDADITAQCPKSDALNGFYQRNDWVLSGADERFNYWLLPATA